MYLWCVLVDVYSCCCCCEMIARALVDFAAEVVVVIESDVGYLEYYAMYDGHDMFNK